ncbi:GroES-like protein [Fomitiporia mediterranea MF3/22]|uniref:GroES-like protein n=1 Tax=Fomitiporia mediterranea (strain MF3/22) TaxID=694068 RepID=UPI0004409C4F|nr:GroES-like protein [Fomitiporia mediterranea MF3/22]EJC99166.1 GroES-like protein [Fomitiporia mediterranea MF3/22]
MSLPATQLGVLSTNTSQTLQSFPVPSPGPKEVLIQNVAVAANPKDWKVPQWTPNYSGIEGNDVSGYIVKVGEGVTEFKGGERVAAFSKMRTMDPKYGAYAQYTVALASDTFPIPESTSFEEASTLPLAVMTAAIGLFKRLGIPETSTGEQKGIIVNGASSSVGAYVVQLAKRAGLFVIGIAGSSKDYAKSLGADVIIDYREHKGDALEQALISASSGHNVEYVYDAITENQSTLSLSRVLAKASPTGKGKVTYILMPSEDELNQIPQGIVAERTGVNTAYGDDEEFAARYLSATA